MSDNCDNESRETVADVVAEMRYGTIPRHRTDHELLALYADRIEAIAKRAYHDIDRELNTTDLTSAEIDAVREAMDNTIGDYYE